MKFASELDELRWRIAANAGRGRAPAPRWWHVCDATAYGSSKARELCRSAGFDPEEQTGRVGALDDLGGGS